LSNRRGFLKKGLGALLASTVALLSLPGLKTTPTADVSAIGNNQLTLLLASKAFLEKAGMLRASSIFHYAPDTGEIQVDWTVSIPPEGEISPQLTALAQHVLSLVNE
jgi:hypothetical protein